jgi:hypothetical protein
MKMLRLGGVFSYVEMSEQTALLACGKRKAFAYVLKSHFKTCKRYTVLVEEDIPPLFAIIIF